MIQAPALTTKGLTFRYRARSSAKGTPVLQDFDCVFGAGRIHGVLGPNGSGKSTLLKLLAGVLSIAPGAVFLFGRDVAELSQGEIARTVALVPQETRQDFPFTIAEMVLMGRFPHHMGWSGWHWERAEDLAVVRRAMQEMDVAHLADRRISDVSGGERQRAVIARALAQEPRVLLLDEPTAFLDLHHQLDIARILRRLNRDRELTVVLVSHDVNLASQSCDRLVLLDRGRIATIGTPEEVVRPDILESVYGCPVLVDRHPQSGTPRVSLPV